MRLVSRPLWPDPLHWKRILSERGRFGSKKGRFKAKTRARAQVVHRTFHRCGKVSGSHVGFHLLAAPLFCSPLGGRNEGKHQGPAIIATGRRGLQRGEKSRRGTRKPLVTAGRLPGYNRGRTAATPIEIEPLGGPLGDNCETYLSAEHAPPSKNSWFSSADAHPSGPGGDCAAPAKGPGQTHPLRRIGTCRLRATYCAHRPTSGGFFEKEEP